MSAPTVLVAPDSFKGTFSAAEVADAIASGLEAEGMHADRCPVADGGEGTMAALVAALRGATATVTASDPLGRPVDAALGLVDAGATAIVEMAEASGLGRVRPEERDAEAASTAGTGELMLAAARMGARRIVVTVGGSATTDGGAGAIGAIEAGGGLGGAKVEVLCDVRTPFEDAARVYGPQKGADEAAVARLTRRLHQQAATLPRDPRGVPMTGAAGGLSGGLWAAFGADLRPGAAAVLDAVCFDERLQRADAVIVGEGRLDAQTLQGKIIGAIEERCRGAGAPLHAIVGSTALEPAELSALALVSVRVASSLSEIEAAARALARELLAAAPA
jgi:glycerate kinase